VDLLKTNLARKIHGEEDVKALRRAQTAPAAKMNLAL